MLIDLPDPRVELRGAAWVEETEHGLLPQRLPAWTRTQQDSPLFGLMSRSPFRPTQSFRRGPRALRRGDRRRGGRERHPGWVRRCGPDSPDAPHWVHYGSSISHGAEAASPARTWVATAARTAGLDLRNLGLSGAAVLDPFLARTIRDGHPDTDVVGARRAAGDAALSYVDGLDLHSADDDAVAPMSDLLHPDPPAHELIGQRAAQVLARIVANNLDQKRATDE